MVIKNTIVKFLPAPVIVVRVVKSVRDRERHYAQVASLARSREAHFACPNRRACSQAMLRNKGVLIVVFKGSPCNNVVFRANQFCV